MTGEQAKEARRLLDWSTYRLGGVCGFSHGAVRVFEATGRMPPSMYARTNPVDRIAVMQAAFEAAGVVFIPENGGGPGVQLRLRKAGGES